MKKVFKITLRKLFWNLPKTLRTFILRRLVQIPVDFPPDIEFKIAETKDEFHQSFHLLYKAYLSVGLQKKNEAQLRVTPYHALPNTTTLIAIKNKKVIATLSLIADSHFGLPCEKAVNLSFIKGNGKRIAEVSALAICKEYRGKLLLPLLKYMYEYCFFYFGIDILIATLTTPSKAHELYETVLGFKPIQTTENKDYSFSNYIPIIVEYLDLKTAKDNYAKIYAHRNKKNDLYSFFTIDKYKRFNLPKRKYYQVEDFVMTPELINHFFIQLTDCFENLSFEEQQRLFKIFPNNEYRSLLPLYNDLKSTFVRSEDAHRYQVRCDGEIYLNPNSAIPIKVLDISNEGFKAYLEQNLNINRFITCSIRVGEFKVFKLNCKLVWSDKNNNYGFKIHTHNEWQMFIEDLKQQNTWNQNSQKAA